MRGDTAEWKVMLVAGSASRVSGGGAGSCGFACQARGVVGTVDEAVYVCGVCHLASLPAAPARSTTRPVAPSARATCDGKSITVRVGLSWARASRQVQVWSAHDRRERSETRVARRVESRAERGESEFDSRPGSLRLTVYPCAMVSFDVNKSLRRLE
jgi:hypothetical protein